VVGMVRDDGDNVRIELASAPAPEKVQEAMVIARGKQRRALTFARVREAPSHPEAVLRLFTNRGLCLVAADASACASDRSMPRARGAMRRGARS